MGKEEDEEETQWTEEIRGGGLHRSNPTVEKAHATWPHQKPEAAFIAHRLLLDKKTSVIYHTRVHQPRFKV